jgi:hypothetical protein
MHIRGGVKRGKYTPNAAKHVAYITGSNRRETDVMWHLGTEKNIVMENTMLASEKKKMKMRDVGDSMDDVQSHGGVTRGGAVI